MKSLPGKRSFLILAFNLFIFSGAGFAQNLDEVTISGRVVDTNNAPIAGAAVTATLAQTGFERAAASDGEGRFRIVELPPGIYKVKVSANGFGAKEQPDFAAIAGQNVRLDFSLAPAEIRAEQTVAVSDDAAAVDTTRTVVGGTVTEREVEELPNNTRNPLDLVFTLGGVTEEPLSTRDLANDRGQRGFAAPGTTPDEAGIFALSGGAAYSNNLTIDGLDNNDDRSASFRFQPSIEAVAEVQIITSQFSAEYGRASGGRVNIRTRAGNNNFRGRFFYFFRDARLNANTWNNNRRGILRPPVTDNDAGATFSGPIVKKKLFFFAAYEYDNIGEDTLIDAWVPLISSNSRFSLPAPTNPQSAVIVSSNVNGQIVTASVAPYIAPFETPFKKHIFSARFDWNANRKQNFTFGFQLGRSNDLRQFSGTNRLADSLIGRIRDTDAFNWTYNYIISSKAVNQFRFQYSRLRPNASTANVEAPVVLITFTPPGESSTTQVFGSSTTNSSDRKEDRWQFQDTFNYVFGSHALRIGGDFQRVNSEFIDRFDATGTYRFSSFAFFNANFLSSFQQAFNNASTIKNTYYGVFVQDDWRIRQNLTLSSGVRYENESIINDKNNFGPRLSVAWNPFKGQKTVIRAGVGIFYNRALLRTIDDFRSDSEDFYFDSRSLPTGTDATIVRSFLSTYFPGPRPLTLDTIVPLSATTFATVRQLAQTGEAFRSLDANIKIPESYQFNVGFEREIFKKIVFEINFTYNKTVRLWREYNPNAPILPAGTPDRDGDGQITFTDYLLGVSTGPNRFELGSTIDTTGTRVSGGTAACTASTPLCVVNLNTRNNSDCASTTNSAICRAFSAIENLRPLLTQGVTGQAERVVSVGNSKYKGLTVELRNRYRKFGFGFAGSTRFVYTLSSLKDDGIVNTSEATLPGDFSREYARSLLDRRHRIAFSATFDLPSWLGGLRLSPLFRFGSSAPFNIGNGGNDRNLDDISNDRPNFTGDAGRIVWRKFDSAFPSDSANRFSLAPIGSPGNLPRNAGRGPKLYVFDFNVSREFKFTERFRLRPAAEFDNVFNMTVYSFGSNFIDFNLLNSANAATVAGAQAGFLAPTRTFRPRQMRFGIRFEF
ncbi:MAG TPA: TonB-dependent receptor [Pyrinomonadaceae bacterium]|jgi:hypothetical protein